MSMDPFTSHLRATWTQGLGVDPCHPGHSIPLISSPISPHHRLRTGSVDFIHSSVGGDTLHILPVNWLSFPGLSQVASAKTLKKKIEMPKP